MLSLEVSSTARCLFRKEAAWKDRSRGFMMITLVVMYVPVSWANIYKNSNTKEHYLTEVWNRNKKDWLLGMPGEERTEADWQKQNVLWPLQHVLLNILHNQYSLLLKTLSVEVLAFEVIWFVRKTCWLNLKTPKISRTRWHNWWNGQY